MLFGPLKYRVLLDDFLNARALAVRLDPTDVLAPPESPSLQAQSSQVQAVRGPTPEKDKGSIGRHRSNVQRHYFLPLPELGVGNAVRPSILLQWRLDENHVKLLSDRFQVETLQITLEVHRRVRRLGNDLIFQPNEF